MCIARDSYRPPNNSISAKEKWAMKIICEYTICSLICRVQKNTSTRKRHTNGQRTKKHSWVIVFSLLLFFRSFPFYIYVHTHTRACDREGENFDELHKISWKTYNLCIAGVLCACECALIFPIQHEQKTNYSLFRLIWNNWVILVFDQHWYQSIIVLIRVIHSTAAGLKYTVLCLAVVTSMPIFNFTPQNN